MARETRPAVMILCSSHFVDIAHRCDRALRHFRESHARSWNTHAMLGPKKDCEAPVHGWRNSGSKQHMRQELREHHNGEGQS
jgi:hypothetical protein